MPVLAGVLLVYSSFTSLWALFSMDWIVGPQGGWGIPSQCNSVKQLTAPISMGQLDNLDTSSSGHLQTTLCDSFSWSLYTTTLEEVSCVRDGDLAATAGMWRRCLAHAPYTCENRLVPNSCGTFVLYDCAIWNIDSRSC